MYQVGTCMYDTCTGTGGLTYVYLAKAGNTVFQIKWFFVPRYQASFLRDTHHEINIQLLFGDRSDQP